MQTGGIVDSKQDRTAAKQVKLYEKSSSVCGSTFSSCLPHSGSVSFIFLELFAARV